MQTSTIEFVAFEAEKLPGFYGTVKSRVGDYFKNNSISPFANRQMWVKSVIMILLYIIPYGLVVSGAVRSNLWVFYGCWLAMGFGVIGIGTSVMHDALHGAFSRRKSVNRAMGSFLQLIGGFSVTWRIQHNLLHHRFTNISGLDEDIQPVKLLRFSPRHPVGWYHRYQHLYAWFFYMLMTLFWMTSKDYLQLMRYRKTGLLITQKTSFSKAVVALTMYKLIYFTCLIGLPVMFAGVHWHHVIGGFLVLHLFAGLALSCIFHPAHVMETSGFAVPVKKNGSSHIEATWASHEVSNTANFAPKNRPLSWFIGGLNFQIEHHLFTSVCHVHYPKIAPIVKQTAAEFGISYCEYPTFFSALRGHYHMLKALGSIEQSSEQRMLSSN